MIIYLVNGSTSHHDNYYEWRVKAFTRKEDAEKFIEKAKAFIEEHPYSEYREIERKFYEVNWDKDYIQNEVELEKLLEPFLNPFGESYPDDEFNGYEIEEVELEIENLGDEE